MKSNQIKSLNPAECPYCHKEFIVEFTATAPQLSGLHTPENIDAAKREALRQIDALSAPEEIAKPIIEWIRDPETIFSPNDIDEIIKNVQKQIDESKKA
jgi:hypothetical protein